MINPISFTSTYKANNIDNFQHEYSQFRSYAVDMELTDGVKIGCQDKTQTSYPYNYTSTTTMIVPDSMDKSVEAFCKSRGIKIRKAKTETLLKPENIEKRIKPAPKGMQLVKVNAQKLDELIQNQRTNLDHCENMYDEYFNEDVDYMIKSGDPIQTSALYIIPSNGEIKYTTDYINRYGAENLNENQLFIDFNQRTDEPDHCTYFALRDLGMKNVPVYVNSETYELGNALELFE